MTDPTTGIPQDGTQLPIQDLQINLEANEVPQDGNAPKIESSELNLDLDLNLSEAPKNDDRLKTEDQKNEIQAKEIVTEPTIETKIEDIFAPMEETLPEIPTLDTPQEHIIIPISDPMRESPIQQNIPDSSTETTIQTASEIPNESPTSKLIEENKNIPTETSIEQLEILPPEEVKITPEVQAQVIQQGEKAITSIQEINVPNSEII
ncbi:MAG: hypothetical protein WCL02_05410 [bacterium]